MVKQFRNLALVVTGSGALSALLFFFVLTQPLRHSFAPATARDSVTERNPIVEKQRAAPRSFGRGALLVGWAEASITPDLGVPTYGYSSRWGGGITRIADSVYVRAVAVQAEGGVPLVFLTADICTWVRPISERITEALEPVISPERIYFMATHTHSGPGGYARGRIDGWIMGGNDARQNDLLVDRTVLTVHSALDDLERGSYREFVISLPQFIQNRIVPDNPVDSDLVHLEFRKERGDLGAITFFGAHATTVNSRSTICSGDYPSALTRALLRNGYSFAMFAASSTAQSGPLFEGERASAEETSTAQRYGEGISQEILSLISGSTVPFVDSINASGLLVTAELPEYQYRVLGRVLNPRITRWLFGESGSALLQGIRLGNTIYLGMPFEVSGVMTQEIKNHDLNNGGTIVMTGFNRDDFLYIMPEEYYYLDLYEPSLSLFGPQFGRHLENQAIAVIRMLSSHTDR